MTIGRTQISKQIDGKLGDPKNKKKQKKKLQVKKSNKKILSLGHLLFKPKVIQSKRLYNRKRLKHYDKTMC